MKGSNPANPANYRPEKLPSWNNLNLFSAGVPTPTTENGQLASMLHAAVERLTGKDDDPTDKEVTPEEMYLRLMRYCFTAYSSTGKDNLLGFEPIGNASSLFLAKQNAEAIPGRNLLPPWSDWSSPGCGETECASCDLKRFMQTMMGLLSTLDQFVDLHPEQVYNAALCMVFPPESPEVVETRKIADLAKRVLPVLNRDGFNVEEFHPEDGFVKIRVSRHRDNKGYRYTSEEDIEDAYRRVLRRASQFPEISRVTIRDFEMKQHGQEYAEWSQVMTPKVAPKTEGEDLFRSVAAYIRDHIGYGFRLSSIEYSTPIPGANEETGARIFRSETTKGYRFLYQKEMEAIRDEMVAGIRDQFRDITRVEIIDEACTVDGKPQVYTKTLRDSTTGEHSVTTDELIDKLRAQFVKDGIIVDDFKKGIMYIRKSGDKPMTDGELANYIRKVASETFKGYSADITIRKIANEEANRTGRNPSGSEPERDQFGATKEQGEELRDLLTDACDKIRQAKAMYHSILSTMPVSDENRDGLLDIMRTYADLITAHNLVDEIVDPA